MKILVTGASGFIGSFIVERGLTEGHAMWAGMRATSSRNYLQDSRIRFVELDMEHPEILRPQLAACKAEFGGWDVIVHAAGATKCIRREDFFRTNTEGTRHFVDALRELDMVPGRFIFIRSLNSVLWYTFPSLMKNSRPMTSFTMAEKTACTRSST